MDKHVSIVFVESKMAFCFSRQSIFNTHINSKSLTLAFLSFSSPPPATPLRPLPFQLQCLVYF